MRALLIEPRDAAAESILAALRREHFTADRRQLPNEAAEAALSGVYDVIIMTFIKNQPEGHTLLRRLREDGCETPVLLLAAHAAPRDRIRALDAGADDVLSSPFVMGELTARVRALARRGTYLQPRLLEVDGLTLDRSRGVVSYGTETQRLSVKELQLLELFLINPHQILPRDLLMQKVWGYDCEPSYNTLEVYLSFVRKKLRAVGATVFIRAARGVGYYLTPAV